MSKAALVQISKAHADDDQICLTIMREPDVHIRVSLGKHRHELHRETAR